VYYTNHRVLMMDADATQALDFTDDDDETDDELAAQQSKQPVTAKLLPD